MRRITKFGTFALMALLICIGRVPEAAAQIFDDPFGPRPQVSTPMQGDEESEADDVVIEIDRSQPDLAPNEMRLQMLDGSILTGQLTTDQIRIETDFGLLDVPIERIRRLRPGLRSYPELQDRVMRLFEALGDADYNTREESRKELMEYGLLLQNVIENVSDDDNAERKRHLDELRKEIDRMASETEFLDDIEPVVPWIMEDTIETDAFTIVGRLQVEQFSLDSRYGQLTIALSDIQTGDRLFASREAINRAVTVSGSNLAQLDYKSSSLRVEAGDRITVRAEGQIVMSPWGSNQFANPDGNSYYGMYNQFPGGALIARIGENGTEFLVGSRKTFVAQSSGVLRFAIAVQADYVGNGYTYPGQYNLRVRVEPN